MKRRLHTILAASAVSAFACSAPAQDTTRPKTDRPEYSRHESASERRADRLNGEIANRIARSENVDNQLEVALKTTSN